MSVYALKTTDSGSVYFVLSWWTKVLFRIRHVWNACRDWFHYEFLGRPSRCPQCCHRVWATDPESERVGRWLFCRQRCLDKWTGRTYD